MSQEACLRGSGSVSFAWTQRAELASSERLRLSENPHPPAPSPRRRGEDRKASVRPCYSRSPDGLVRSEDGLFKQEYVELLEENGVDDYDENDLWE